MIVNLKFFAGLRNYLPEARSPYPAEFPEGSTVADVLKTYDIPEEKPRILLVNGRHAKLSQALHDGDLLSVFPPVAGG